MPSARKKTPLPKPESWQHRPGQGGYYITDDGLYQMLLNASEQFVICTTKEIPGKGYSVLHGPASSPQELGIPDALIAEGEAKMMDDLFVSLKAGKHISVSLNGKLGP